MNTTYTIHTENIAQFNKLVQNANKKAAKLGVTPYTVTVGPEVNREVVINGKVRFETVCDVTIVGSTPKFNGWRLTGVVSPLQTDSGALLPIVTTVPGESVKGAADARDPLWCDHCKVRRDRLESFIVCHDDGTERQVGRNCLKDFLGDDRMSPAGLAALMNTLASISDSVAQFSRSPRHFHAESLELIMACTASVIRHNGWLSATAAFQNGGTATKVTVNNVLDGYLAMPENTLDAKEMERWRSDYGNIEGLLPTEADFADARQARDNLSVFLDSKDEVNEYLTTIRVLNQTGAVNRRSFGIAVSVYPFICRETGKSLDPVSDLLFNARKNGGFVAEIGKRVVMNLTFIEAKLYNESFINTFVDDKGNVVKIWGSFGFSRGQKVVFKATVTKHEEFRGSKAVVCNRAVDVSPDRAYTAA